MNDQQDIDFSDREAVAAAVGSHARAMGSPLSMGVGSRPATPPEQVNPNRLTPGPSPVAGRALSTGSASGEISGIQKAINALRMVVPIVQRILPLLDGNIGTAVSNFLTPHPHPQPAPPPPKVDLVPLEEGLAELQTQHRTLRDQVMEQNTSLKRVEDQLEMVREATDRNTLEQQELLEDLKAFSGRVKVVAIIALGLLSVSLVLNLILYLHIQRVLP